MDDPQTVLLRLTGPNQLRVSAGLMALLNEAGASVHDIEQIVIRNRLSLSLAVDVPRGRDLLKEVLVFGWERGLEVDFEVADSAPAVLLPAHVVTIVGPRLTPSEIGAATNAIADAGGSIDRIIRLARRPVMSYEFLVRDGDEAAMRANLIMAAAEQPGLDVAVQRDGLSRRAERLIVLDVDSTLIQNEAVELLAEQAGNAAEVRRITEAAMEGELEFETALRERVLLLRGLDESAIARAAANMRLTPGADTFVRTLKRLGYTTAIVSGGFTPFTERLRLQLDIDHAYANELEIIDGVTTGNLVGRVIDRQAKADLVRQIAATERVPLEQVVAIGDGANDIDMLASAGLGIAFNAKATAKRAADASLTVPYLDSVLFFLGVRREEIEAADIVDGHDDEGTDEPPANR